jgi:uncharacterized protein (TIGR02611 family)
MLPHSFGGHPDGLRTHLSSYSAVGNPPDEWSYSGIVAEDGVKAGQNDQAALDHDVDEVSGPHGQTVSRSATRFLENFIRARERVRAHPAMHRVYQIIVGVAGVLVIIVGFVLVPLPGPGWLIVLLGLAILASEFAPARRVLEFVRERLARWTHWVGRRSWPVRVLLGLATLLIVAAALFASARQLGLLE